LTANQAATVTVRIGNQSGTVAVSLATPTSVTLATAPATPIAGQPMTLTITPATGTAPSVVVDWGDGSTQNLGVVAAARSVTHTYSSPGNYSINVTATGQGGDTFSTATTVVVAPRPGPTITVAPTSGATTVTFAFTVTPPQNTAGSIRVEFGDGDAVELGTISSATAVTHRYGAAGTYVARAIMTDSSGATTTGSVVVTVTQ
jgi:PKD repeat protein